MIGSFDLPSVARLVIRVLMATVVASLAAYLISLALMPVGEGMLGGFVRLVVAGGIGIALAFALCAVQKVPEMHYVTDLVDKVLARFKK